MKKTLVILICSVMSFSLYAQDSYVEVVRSTIKTEKKALIAEVMQLTDEESAKFWPVYNEYEEKLYKINTDYFNLIMRFADNYENMSDEVATEIINSANKVFMDKAKLKKTYMKKMSKVISPQKTLRYFQASNKIDVMIDAQLASEIPLLDDIK